MKRLKKVLRLLFLVCLIVLASIGISIGGGIPVPASHKKEVAIEVTEELPEGEEQEAKGYRS